MKILQFTDPTDLEFLTKPLKKCNSLNDYKLAWEYKEKFFDLCKQYNWVWLSANQVWINKRFFIINTDTLQELFINPKLLSWTWQILKAEWCLSFANWKQSLKKRYKSIEVQFENELKEKFTTKLSWLNARVFQHELDHMNWIII